MTNIDLIKKALQSQYPFSFDGDWSKLTGGYECDIWRVGQYVVRICPEWRSDAELDWVYRHVAMIGEQIPEVVSPIKTKDDTYFIRFENRPVVIFPYIEGELLDRNNPELLRQAAELLAQIHNTSSRSLENITRPPSDPSAPTEVPLQNDPKYIQDPQLDTWYNQFMASENLKMGLMHGDYYRGNILCDGDVINGVIDWDELTYGEIIREIAWATWEQCHTESGDYLDIERARLFVTTYQGINNTLSSFEYKAIIPLIRYHLRYEIRRSFAAEEAGEDWDEDYRQQEIRAFNNLRNLVFTLF